MVYDHAVKFAGVIYPPGTQVPQPATKNTENAPIDNKEKGKSGK